MHIHPDVCVYPDLSAHWYIHTVHRYTTAHMLIGHVDFMCTFARRGTYFSVCTCPHTRDYTHRLTPVYMCAQRSRHACIPTPICTPLHTTYIQTQNCTCIYRWYLSGQVHIFADRTTFKNLNACIYALLHSVTQAPRCCRCSVIMNSQATLSFQPSGWLSLLSLSLPSPTPMTGSECSCQPQCLPSASRPPGVPRSLINPLANWPPAP